MLAFIKNTSKILLVLAFLGLGISFTANQVFEAKDLYSLTLDAGDGAKFSNNESILMINNIKAGTKFNEVKGLETPVKEECDFIKWTINDQDIDSNYKITSNVVVKAHFTVAPIHEYTVTLKSKDENKGWWLDSESHKITTYTLPGKHSAIRLSDLNWLKININLDDDYDIKWYLDEECKKELDDVTLIEKDTTIYADFVLGNISVTFIENKTHPYVSLSEVHFNKNCQDLFNTIDKPKFDGGEPSSFNGWDDVSNSTKIEETDKLPYYLIPNSVNRTRLLWVIPMFKGEMSVIFSAYDYTNDISGYIKGDKEEKIYYKTIECEKGMTWNSFQQLHSAEIPDVFLDGSLNDEYERYTRKEESKIIKSWFLANGEEVPDNHSFEYTTILYPKYVIKSANSFIDDSWRVICNEFTTKGFNYITNEANNHPYYQYYKDRGETFVGAIKKLHLNGFDKDYNVRVIGECQDEYYTDVEKTKTAKTGLTFEFEEVIYDAPYSDKRINNYENSSVRNYSLNMSLLNNMPAALKDDGIGIKSSIKRTLKGKVFPYPEVEPAESDYIHTEDKLFLLSMNEMNFNSNRLLKEEEKIQKEGFKDEKGVYNGSYQYYESINDATATRIKKYNGTTHKYWLRSPDFESHLFSWTINESGNLGNDESPYTTMVDEGYGVAPAFAIGVQSI